MCVCSVTNIMDAVSSRIRAAISLPEITVPRGVKKKKTQICVKVELEGMHFFLVLSVSHHLISLGIVRNFKL